MKKIKKIKQWSKYLFKDWFRNHPLGMRGFVTNKKGVPEYCYRCGNFSNGVVKKYKIFSVPICTKHHQEETKS